MTIQIHVFFMYSLFIKNPFAKNRKIQQHRPDMYLHEAALSCDGPAASLTLISPLIHWCYSAKLSVYKPFLKRSNQGPGAGLSQDRGEGDRGKGRWMLLSVPTFFSLLLFLVLCTWLESTVFESWDVYPGSLLGWPKDRDKVVNIWSFALHWP